MLTLLHWGLSADIQVPDYDTRIKIIIQLLEKKGLEMSTEVIDYLASNFSSNLGDLELAVGLLLLQSTFSKKEIDLDFAKRSVEGTKCVINF